MNSSAVFAGDWLEQRTSTSISTSTREVRISEGVKIIGEGAFFACHMLTEVRVSYDEPNLVYVIKRQIKDNSKLYTFSPSCSWFVLGFPRWFSYVVFGLSKVFHCFSLLFPGFPRCFLVFPRYVLVYLRVFSVVLCSFLSFPKFSLVLRTRTLK